MRALVTANTWLYKTPDGLYWSKFVYGYDFFKRYLDVFDEIQLVAHSKNILEKEKVNMVKVSGEGVRVFEMPSIKNKWDYMKNYLRIKKEIPLAVKDCDVAILRIPDPLAFDIFKYIKRIGMPISIEVTTNSWEYFAPGSRKSILRPIIRYMWDRQQKKCCLQANGVAYVTQNYLQKRYPSRASIEGKNNLYFDTYYTSASIDETWYKAPRKYVGHKDKIITLIHVSGSLNTIAKGHKELITAVGILKKQGVGLKLVLVGAGKLNFLAQKAINDYELYDDIRLTGLITDVSQLQGELEKADIFVFPSYNEGLPRVVIEAMASGLPCIASDIPGIRELISSESLVPVKDDLLLAQKILEFIEDFTRLEKESFNNYHKALDYRCDVVQSRRNDFYKKLIEVYKFKNLERR